MNVLRFRSFVLFPLFHLVVLYVLLTNPSWLLILTVGILSALPIHTFGYSIGYHKMFAHGAFKAKTFYPYLSTFIAMLALYGGPLATSLAHRIHHRFVDTDRDPHSPCHGRWHAYIGWLVKPNLSKRDAIYIKDIVTNYPWTRLAEKYDLAVPLIVYPLLFWISPVLGGIIMIGCLLSLHIGLLVNAYGHDPKIEGEVKTVNRIWLANLITPAFNHRQHHTVNNGYDDGDEHVYDWQALIIRKFLLAK